MTIQPPPADALGLWLPALSPGPRLGWVFRDRRQLAAPFPEPPPDLEAMRACGRVGLAPRPITPATASSASFSACPAAFCSSCCCSPTAARPTSAGTGPPVAAGRHRADHLRPGHRDHRPEVAALATVGRPGRPGRRRITVGPWRPGGNVTAAHQQAQLARLGTPRVGQRRTAAACAPTCSAAAGGAGRRC